MTETPCPHQNIEYDVNAIPAAKHSNIIMTEIAARCADCGSMMRWCGSYPTEPRTDRTFVSEDGLWLTVPMHPSEENPFLLIDPVN